VEQLALSPAMHWQQGGARIRALLNRAVASNGLSLQDLALETGIDERQIARALHEGGGAHPPLPLLAALLHLDRAGVLVTGLAALVGYEARPKAPDLAGENRRLREELAAIRTRLDELLDP
jgi:transcriptional regulator with XRE-family HTH domain